ncbi:DUF6207 family protein [Streptomyces sp. NPDC050149]
MRRLRRRHQSLEQRWATPGATPSRHMPGEPGFRARIYADIRRRGTRP